MGVTKQLQMCTNIEIFMAHTHRMKDRKREKERERESQSAVYAPASFRNAILISSAQQATAKQHPSNVAIVAIVAIIVALFVSARCAIISAAHFLTDC